MIPFQEVIESLGGFDLGVEWAWNRFGGSGLLLATTMGYGYLNLPLIGS